MRSKVSFWSLSLAGWVCLSTVAAPAQDASDNAKTGESLWEISKRHLKDPFRWPSVWRSNPQATDPNGIEALRRHPQTAGASEAPAIALAPAKPRNDWRASEERRTRTYLKKVAPLNMADYLPMPAEEPIPAQTTAEGSPKHFLAQPLVLSTPFLSPDDGSGIFPGESKIKYQSSNQSDILLLYDEVSLTIGEEAGVKQGDLFRTYDVGGVFRSFTSGRRLGRLVETNGIVEVVRVKKKTSVARLVRCYGTISRDTRASLLEPMQEVTATGYQPQTDGKLSGQVVWVSGNQQLTQPFSYALVDRGADKGFKIGDMVLFFNRHGGKMTEKVLGNGLVVNVQSASATILIQDLYPGIVNRGDYAVVIQTAVL